MTTLNNSISRSKVLSKMWPLVTQGDYHQQDSTIDSSFRQGWDSIFEWRDFIDEVNTYWESLPQEEKDTLLLGQGHEQWLINCETIWRFIERPTDELGLCEYLNLGYRDLHNIVLHYPSIRDKHASIATRRSGLNVVGNPDYVFISESVNVCAVMEAKTFWKLFPRHIRDMLNSILLLLCTHFH